MAKIKGPATPADGDEGEANAEAGKRLKAKNASGPNEIPSVALTLTYLDMSHERLREWLNESNFTEMCMLLPKIIKFLGNPGLIQDYMNIRHAREAPGDDHPQ